MKLVFDSNVFVSALDPNDMFHSECRPLFEKLLRFEVESVSPIWVLVEAASVLRRRVQSDVIVRHVWMNLARLPSIHWLEITSDAAERACEIVARTGLRAGDAIVVQVAEELGVPLVTKDKEFWRKRLPGVLLFQPGELPF